MKYTNEIDLQDIEVNLNDIYKRDYEGEIMIYHDISNDDYLVLEGFTQNIFLYKNDKGKAYLEEIEGLWVRVIIQRKDNVVCDVLLIDIED